MNNYLSEFDDIVIHISYPGENSDKIGKLEVINPLFERFVFDFKANDVIYLKKDIIVNSNGKFYLIFNTMIGNSFYIHSIHKYIPLNIINNYYSDIKNNTLSNGGFQIFNFIFESDRYIYISYIEKIGSLLLYCITNKITTNLTKGYSKIEKGSYIILMDYSRPLYDSSSLYIYINRNILNLELNHEIQIGSYDLGIFIDLSKYNEEIYLVSNRNIKGRFKCIKNLTDEEIMNYDFETSTYSYSHYIMKLAELTKSICNPPYIAFQVYYSRFELVSEVYQIYNSQNLTFKHNDSAIFKLDNDKYDLYYYLIISDLENLKIIDKSETEFVNIILRRADYRGTEKVVFKLIPNNKIDTNLRITKLENKNNIQIETLTSAEISSRLIYNNEKIQIKYYINLSKNKILINHFDYNENIEFYLSKDDINENNLETILNTEEVNTDIFELMANETFEVDINKIIAYKIKNNTFSELLMSPEIHSFIIQNTSNSKYLKANRRYIIDTYLKIILVENSEANIVVTDTNNQYIFTINKNNTIFENKIYTNKSLFLVSDKDVLLFIYHQIDKNSRNIVYPKDGEGKLILFRSDCYSTMKYTLDFGFENYIPSYLSLKDMESSYLILNTTLEYNNIPKGVDYFLYFECSSHIQNYYSGYYINLFLKEGVHYIEENKTIKMDIKLDELKNNIYYQFLNCENSSYKYFHVSIDEEELKNIGSDGDFITANNNISFYLQGESFFNYYITNSTLEDYKNLDKNFDIPSFKIISISDNKMNFELKVKYTDINFTFYLFVYIDEENTMTSPIKNLCYCNKLIEQKNNLQNNNNIIIKKITYENKILSDNTIDIPSIKNNTIVYSNVFGSGKIFDDIEEYIFYDEQSFSYIIKNDPEPKPSGKGTNKDKDTSLSAGEIAGIIIGLVVFVVIIVFIILKCRKKDSIDLEESKIPLNI